MSNRQQEPIYLAVKRSTGINPEHIAQRPRWTIERAKAEIEVRALVAARK